MEGKFREEIKRGKNKGQQQNWLKNDQSKEAM